MKLGGNKTGNKPVTTQQRQGSLLGTAQSAAVGVVVLAYSGFILPFSNLPVSGRTNTSLLYCAH